MTFCLGLFAFEREVGGRGDSCSHVQGRSNIGDVGGAVVVAIQIIMKK